MYALTLSTSGICIGGKFITFAVRKNIEIIVNFIDGEISYNGSFKILRFYLRI